MKKEMILKSLVKKCNKKVVKSDKWLNVIHLVNDVENWFNFNSAEGDNWDKFENTCIECAMSTNTLKEAQNKFNLVY